MFENTSTHLTASRSPKFAGYGPATAEHSSKVFAPGQSETASVSRLPSKSRLTPASIARLGARVRADGQDWSRNRIRPIASARSRASLSRTMYAGYSRHDELKPIPRCALSCLAS